MFNFKLILKINPIVQLLYFQVVGFSHKMLYNKIMEGMIYIFEYYEDFVYFIGNRLPSLREQKKYIRS